MRDTVVEGDYAVNQAGFVIHSAVHAEHPEILAMCHAHTVYGSAYASLGRPLAPITQDACAFFEDHAVLAQESGKVSVERGAGFSMAGAFKGVKAVIHQNHGLFTVSRHSIDSAAFLFHWLERCCQMQLMIDASGPHADRDPPGKGALQPEARRQRVRRVALLPVRLRQPRADQPGHVPLEPAALARAALVRAGESENGNENAGEIPPKPVAKRRTGRGPRRRERERRTRFHQSRHAEVRGGAGAGERRRERNRNQEREGAT